MYCTEKACCCAAKGKQQQAKAPLRHHGNAAYPRISQAADMRLPPVALVNPGHRTGSSARSSVSDTASTAGDFLEGHQLKKAAAICHKLHSKKYQPVGLDQKTIDYLVESQIAAGVPVRAPWYREAPSAGSQAWSKDRRDSPSGTSGISSSAGTGFFIPKPR